VIDAIEPLKMASTSQYQTHIRCPATFICCGCAYGFFHIAAAPVVSNLLGDTYTYNSGYLLRGKQQWQCSVVVEAINPSKMFSLSISNTYDI
jgi:hypothetical protein